MSNLRARCKECGLRFHLCGEKPASARAVQCAECGLPYWRDYLGESTSPCGVRIDVWAEQRGFVMDLTS